MTQDEIQEQLKIVAGKINLFEKKAETKTKQIANKEAHKVKLDAAFVTALQNMTNDLSFYQSQVEILNTQKGALEAQIVP